MLLEPLLITRDELNNLPYLDKFVRELLRFDTPLPQVVRTADVDCVIPLGKPVVGRDGSLISEIKVPKGTDFVVRKYSSIATTSLPFFPSLPLAPPPPLASQLPSCFSQHHTLSEY